MRSRLAVAVIASSLGVLAPLRLVAQSAHGVERQVLMSVAREMKSFRNVPVESKRLDARVWSAAGAGETHVAGAASLAQAFGATLGIFENLIECSGRGDVQSVHGCELDSTTKVLLALSGVTVDGDTARVTVYSWQHASRRRGIATAVTTYTLERKGGTWKIVASHHSVIS